jgi:hypothetical protein
MSDIKTNNIADGERSATVSSYKETVISTYTAAELELASKRLHVPKECIRAALKEQKKTVYTMEEAVRIIQNFLSREVK